MTERKRIVDLNVDDLRRETYYGRGGDLNPVGVRGILTEVHHTTEVTSIVLGDVTLTFIEGVRENEDVDLGPPLG
jgi:hypothetical protein